MPGVLCITHVNFSLLIRNLGIYKASTLLILTVREIKYNELTLRL